MDSVTLEGEEDCTGEADGVDGPRKEAKRLMKKSLFGNHIANKHQTEFSTASLAEA